MKNILYTMILSFSFSFSVFADWTFVAQNTDGTNIFIDYDKIKEQNGYIYFWQLTNYNESKDRIQSTRNFYQGDCNLGRLKILSFSTNSLPWFSGEILNPADDFKPDVKWRYTPPGTMWEAVLTAACRHSK